MKLHQLSETKFHSLLEPLEKTTEDRNEILRQSDFFGEIENCHLKSQKPPHLKTNVASQC